jgi:hypothetical protein
LNRNIDDFRYVRNAFSNARGDRLRQDEANKDEYNDNGETPDD